MWEALEMSVQILDWTHASGEVYCMESSVVEKYQEESKSSCYQQYYIEVQWASDVFDKLITDW